MLLHFLVIYTEHAKKGRRCVPFFRSSSLFRRIEIDEASLQNDTALILCQRVHAKFNILDPVPGDMFGRNFRRGLDDDINAALNYGYVVLTSAAARIAAAHGYMPFIGFHHIGEANNVNLACDCVEPFRPLVDFAVRLHLGEELDKPLKARLLSALNMTVRYGERRMAASDAMDGYFLDLMRSLKEKKIVTKELKVL